MSDPFEHHTNGLESPATALAPVIPDDTTDLVTPSRALNVAQAGFVRVTTTEGSEATLYIAAGLAFPVRVRRVWATGTTATDIVALS